ncbi:N-acetylmuramoyl-L-alanine amidase [Bacillus sp. FJAT-52991]|uniref:N-acetylmuramoyl-L-alanine amidase n=1 Tax=Bacillus kandeliae TaxID=3129297 RepID=A0ABZ2N5F3_9BACI
MKKRVFLIFLSCLLVMPILGLKSKAFAASTFSDVPDSHRAAKEIYYLSKGGIAQGSSSYQFSPNKSVTRAEAVTMIGRALQLDGTQRPTSFKDVGSGSFASGYIQSAADKGIVSGYGDGSFLPNKVVTRGEMALMICKAFEYPFNNSTSGAAQALMSRGIAQGLADGSFGYDEPMIRADFSVFLARAINPDFRLKANTVKFDQNLTVNVNDLNVRTGPNNAYEKVGSLNKGTAVKGAYSVGAWYYIQAGSIKGFVHGNYLDGKGGSGGATNPTPPPTKPQPPTSNVDPRIKDQVIVIDPGHGGKDPGAVGYGINEKDVVLATGLKVNELFKKTPFQVKMTRSTDKYVSLSGRVSYAESVKGNTFVSIHANAANGSASGSETYYYAAKSNPHTADSKLLATKIQNRLVAAWNLKDRGVKSKSLHVLRENSMPAALVELGFIDNKNDNAKLKSDYWQNAAAKAIYYGVLDYYKAKGYKVDSLYSVAK